MSKMLSYLIPAVASLLLATGPLKAEEADIWPDLRSQFFGKTAISENDGSITLDAPVRAEDASLVPLTVSWPAELGAQVKKLTLIVDYNPAPMAATFIFGDGAAAKTRRLTTRLRIDRYSFVRAVVETKDGKLLMATKFVKASGGCSAPAGKDAAAALVGAGKMQIMSTIGKAASVEENEAQVMIKHPNFTGMQMDQVTRDYTPARFIQEMEVKSGGELVFRMESGISISENPHFRFMYPEGSKGTIEVTAKDTEGQVFTGKSQAANGS